MVGNGRSIATELTTPARYPPLTSNGSRPFPLRFADQSGYLSTQDSTRRRHRRPNRGRFTVDTRAIFVHPKPIYNTFVVHGHTPTNSGLPDLFSNRLNLDTGGLLSVEN